MVESGIAFDAIVPAGGAAQRLGGADKPGLLVAGRPLLDHVLLAASAAGRIVVVGPRRPTVVPVRWRRDDPPGGGPVAALVAALPEVSAPWCLVLAADLPNIAPAVPVLLAAAGGHDAAVLTTARRQNYLAAAWATGALRDAVRTLGEPHGAPVRTLFAGRDVIEVDDPAGWGRDCDTWPDVAAARSAAVPAEPTKTVTA